jgi:transcriptional regulator GlxA family with amidase domain
MAAAYIEEDLKVMREGSLLNRLWMVHNVSYRLPQWFVSSKVQVLSLKQEVLGIAGVMYPMNSSHLQDKYFQELKPLIAFVEENYMEDIKMDKLATLINCSRTQLNRRFQALLHMTPTEFLMALRVQAARRLLATTQKDIADIAYESGFCDQSHLTRRFRILTGETPASYRKKIFK